MLLFLNSFNGLAVWLPDVYSRLAVYSEANPNDTVTICHVVAALADNKFAAGTSFRSTDADIQMHRAIDNLTYTELMKTNNIASVAISPVLNYAEDSVSYNLSVYNTTIADTVAAPNATWPYSDTNGDTCSSTVNEAVFRNSLAIGVVCAIVYTSAGYLVDCIQKKPLMSKSKTA